MTIDDLVQVLILLIVVAMRKRVELVAALFREAGKSVHAMPLLLIQPIWTLLALCLLCCGWLYGAIWIESSGLFSLPGFKYKNSHNARIFSGYPNRATAGLVFFKKDTFLQVGQPFEIR